MKLHTDQMRVKIIKVVDPPEGKLPKFRSLMFQHIVSKRDKLKEQEKIKINDESGKPFNV